MEHITANVVGKPKRVTKNGREYLVARATMLMPQVLPGSNGPLFYPPEETDRHPDTWNGMPVTVNHPEINGIAVSARHPDVLEKQGIGQVFKSYSQNGKLRGEVWIDIEKARNVDALLGTNVLDRMAKGYPVELSTGLYTENEPAPPGATHNGISYPFIARNYRPDHLAILPNKRGACSVSDGCGVNVNEEIQNAFCPTGKDGGQDNSCDSRGGSGGGHASAHNPEFRYQNRDDRNSDDRYISKQKSSLEAKKERVEKIKAILASKKAAHEQKVKDLHAPLEAKKAEIASSEKYIAERKDAGGSKVEALKARLAELKAREKAFKEHRKKLRNNAFCATSKGGGQDNSCSASEKEKKLTGNTMIEQNAWNTLGRKFGKLLANVFHANAKDRLGHGSEKRGAKALSQSDETKAAYEAKAAYQKQSSENVSKQLEKQAKLKSAHTQMSNMSPPDVRDLATKYGIDHEKMPKHEWQRALAEKMVGNAFCPTGEGGGQDNSCSGRDGGSAKVLPVGSQLTEEQAKDNYKTMVKGWGRKGMLNLLRKGGLPSASITDDDQLAEMLWLNFGKKAHQKNPANPPIDFTAPSMGSETTKGTHLFTNSEGADDMAQNAKPLTDAQRNAHVDFLITNCACTWKEEDREVLNEFSDNQLTSLKTNAEQLTLTVNTLKEVSKAAGLPDDIKLNEVAGAVKSLAAKADPDEELTDPKDTEGAAALKKGYKGDAQNPTGNKRMTMKQIFEQHGTAEDRAIWNQMASAFSEKKNRLIGVLVSNAANDDARKEAARIYSKMDLPELESLVKANGLLAQNQGNGGHENRRQQEISSNFFDGGFRGFTYSEPTNNVEADDENAILAIPTLNEGMEDDPVKEFRRRSKAAASA